MCVVLPRSVAPSARSTGYGLVLCLTWIVLHVNYLVDAVLHCTERCLPLYLLQLWLLGNIGWNYVACVVTQPHTPVFVSNTALFCQSCQAHRAPTPWWHCHVCARCVIHCDRHCPPIANCLGRHNRRPFVKLLVWLVVACALACLLYTSDAADEEDSVDLGGRRIL
eukprot:TRINITY_DN6609_c0_g1_i4.p2 TRINITY_DN6609_c0_g1~~TRINITY_DN6609_c0_g1_i4.p2  ORF type:complete len:166 (-),score=23.03 TRINITY_DN6609_c0_g1_i4:109-606(-)